jgi:uncharacterized protein with PQ loop repeat
MPPMELTATLGWIATLLFTACYIPQILKTARTNTVDGLSFWLLFISLVANVIALWYATRIAQMPLIVKYIAGIVFVSICLFFYVRAFRSQRSRAKRSAQSL